MGAWIEIMRLKEKATSESVAPAWGRGLKFPVVVVQHQDGTVAPAWGRGLKSDRENIGNPFVYVAPAWGRGLKYGLPF